MNSWRVTAPETNNSFDTKTLSPHFSLLPTFTFFIFNMILFKTLDPFCNTGQFYYEKVTLHFFTHVHLPCMLGLDNAFTRTLMTIFSSGSNKPSLPTSPTVLIIRE